MDTNDQGVIMTNAIRALERLNLAGYGSEDERAERRSDAMHSILIIIEQVRQARDRDRNDKIRAQDQD